MILDEAAPTFSVLAGCLRVADPAPGEGGHDYPPDDCVRTLIFEPRAPVRREGTTTHQAFFPAGIAVVEYPTHLDRI